MRQSPKVERTVRREIASLRRHIEKSQKRLATLERFYAELQGVETANRQPVLKVPLKGPHQEPPRRVGPSQLAVATIIGNNGSPMRIAEIANKAFQSGEIKSAIGYKGVYNIVQTILKRDKINFVKVGPGTYAISGRPDRVVRLVQ
ncbi:MAG TPA: hypothetical protein VGZ23_07030 [bacterium]|nr:hypothetical protein [bacterium]